MRLKGLSGLFSGAHIKNVIGPFFDAGFIIAILNTRGVSGLIIDRLTKTIYSNPNILFGFALA